MQSCNHAFLYRSITDDLCCAKCAYIISGMELMQNGEPPNLKMAPEIPAQRILDEFGFPIPETPKASISSEDLELTKRFLKDAQDKP